MKTGAALAVLARLFAVLPLTLLVLFAGVAGLITVIWPTTARREMLSSLGATVVEFSRVIAGTATQTTTMRRQPSA